MTYRSAKRRVCRMASSVLERCEPEEFADMEKADCERLSKAWDELTQELFERGEERSKP